MLLPLVQAIKLSGLAAPSELARIGTFAVLPSSLMNQRRRRGTSVPVEVGLAISSPWLGARNLQDFEFR